MFLQGGVLNIVWAKYSLFEALDPLGKNALNAEPQT